MVSASGLPVAPTMVVSERRVDHSGLRAADTQKRRLRTEQNESVRALLESARQRSLYMRWSRTAAPLHIRRRRGRAARDALWSRLVAQQALRLRRTLAVTRGGGRRGGAAAAGRKQPPAAAARAARAAQLAVVQPGGVAAPPGCGRGGSSTAAAAGRAMHATGACRQSRVTPGPATPCHDT